MIRISEGDNCDKEVEVRIPTYLEVRGQMHPRQLRFDLFFPTPGQYLQDQSSLQSILAGAQHMSMHSMYKT